MREWTIRLLGGFEFSGPDGPIRLESAKTAALFAYLCAERRAHARPKLAGLLWGDLPEERAQCNLRRALWDIRRKTGSADGFIRTTRTDVAFAADGVARIDVILFQEACQELATTPSDPLSAGEARSLQSGVFLHRGSFMEGLYLEGATGFEEWLYTERERLRVLAATALARLARIQEGLGDLAAGLDCARRLVALDPWLEDGHRALMRLMALSGEPAEALNQYEALCRILSEELGSTPTEETADLCAAIRSGELMPSGPGSGSSKPHPPPHNLPLQPTPFVGRSRELASIRTLLADPSCRLLTLLGPGGIGKTRLAVEAASGLRAPLEGPGVGPFPDGIFFVSLNELDSASRLPSAVRDALGLAVAAAEDPVGQISGYLPGRRLLLVLDAFEQVLDGTPWIAEILQMDPGVRVLATSRERLDLKGEWVFEVRGMGLPEGGRGEGAPGDAVDLFLQGARRVNLGFDPEGADLSQVIRICRLVEGMPLGIELASACARHLTPAEIAAEIEASFDFLVSPSRDVPERQRSFRAVFDHAWGRLSPAERRVFASLSAFRGGFRRTAARAVAEAPVELLSSLIDKSLLGRAPSGRYRIHEVLRQYGEVRLRETPPEWEATQARHRDFFLGWLAQACDGDIRAAETSEEIENIRAAWHCAAASGERALLLAAMDRFTDLHDTAGLFREGLKSIHGAGEKVLASTGDPGPEGALWDGTLHSCAGLFQIRMGQYGDAAASLEEALSWLREAGDPLALAKVLCRLGEARLWLGLYASAEGALLESIPLAEGLQRQTLAAEALNLLGRISRERGDIDEARSRLEESLVRSRRAADEALQTRVLNQLAYLESYRGDMVAARRYREEALLRARSAGDRTSAALALSGLGVVEMFAGDYSGARAHLIESLALCRQIGDRNGVARALANLAEVAREQGSFQEALDYNRESMDLHEVGGNRMALASGFANAGLSQIALGRLKEARRNLLEGLRLSSDLGALPILTASLTAFARLLHAEGRPYEALEVLGAALAHPAVTVDARRDAAPLIAALRADLPARRVEAALKRGRTRPIEEMARRLGA